MILLLEQFLYQKNCYFNVRRYSWIHTFIAKLSDRCFCWFRRHVQVPIRIDTNQLASPQKSLWIMKNCTDQSKGLRWCGFVRFLVRFCGNIYVKLRYYDFTKPSGLRVISMRFAVFLCYSVRCLFVILFGFAIFVPPLRPPLIFLSKNFAVMPRTPLGSRRPLGTSTQRINPRYNPDQ